jgi:hypothetical protein
MAEPLRRAPDTVRPEHDINLYRYGGEKGSPRRFLWLIALAVAIGAAALPWILGADTTKSTTVNAAPPARTIPATNEPPIMDVPSLLKSKSADVLGKEVVLRDVLVQSANGQNSIFVGPGKDQQVLVVPEPNAIPDTLQGKERPLNANQIVTVAGTIAAPRESEHNMQHEWKLSPSEVQQVEKTGFYVEASSVRPQTY